MNEACPARVTSSQLNPSSPSCCIQKTVTPLPKYQNSYIQFRSLYHREGLAKSCQTLSSQKKKKMAMKRNSESCQLEGLATSTSEPKKRKNRYKIIRASWITSQIVFAKCHNEMSNYIIKYSLIVSTGIPEQDRAPCKN